MCKKQVCLNSVFDAQSISLIAGDNMHIFDHFKPLRGAVQKNYILSGETLFAKKLNFSKGGGGLCLAFFEI